MNPYISSSPAQSSSCGKYSEHTRKRKRASSSVDDDIENRSVSHSDDNNGKTRRVNPFRLAERLDPNLVREMETFIRPGAMMPNFSIRKELQERYQVDRRHLYDYFHSRGLRVAKEDRHSNLTRSRQAKAQALKAIEVEKPSQSSSSFINESVKPGARSKCKPQMKASSKVAFKSAVVPTRSVLADICMSPQQKRRKSFHSSDNDIPSAHISTGCPTLDSSLPVSLPGKSEAISLDLSDAISCSLTSPPLSPAALPTVAPLEDSRRSTAKPSKIISKEVGTPADETSSEPFSPSEFVQEFFDPLEEWISFPSEDPQNDSPFPTVLNAMSINEREDLYSSIISNIHPVNLPDIATDQLPVSSKKSIAQVLQSVNVGVSPSVPTLSSAGPCVAEHKVATEPSVVSQPLSFSFGPQGFNTFSLTSPSVLNRHSGSICAYPVVSDLSSATIRDDSLPATVPGFSTVLLQSLDPASPIPHIFGSGHGPAGEHLPILDVPSPCNTSQDPSRLGATEIVLNSRTSDFEAKCNSARYAHTPWIMVEKEAQSTYVPHGYYPVARPRVFVPQPSHLRTISAGGGI